MATVWGLATKASWTPVFDYLFVCLFVVIVCCNATSDQNWWRVIIFIHKLPILLYKT